MRIVLAVVMVLGSVSATVAAETYSDYHDYFGSEPTSARSTGPKSMRKTVRSVDAIDTRRYHDGSASRNTDPLRPGYRGAAGTYVAPDYSSRLSGLAGDGFGGWGGRSYGSYGAPNSFSGSLGTRR